MNIDPEPIREAADKAHAPHGELLSVRTDNHALKFALHPTHLSKPTQ